MNREERIEYLAKAVMTLSELGDNKTASVLNEIRLELKQQPFLPSDEEEAAREEYPDTGEASVDFKLIQRREDFKAGAEWQMKQDHDRCYQCEKNRDTVYWKGWNDCKAKILEEAVEGEVCGRVYDHINVRFADGVSKYLEPKNISHIPADTSKYEVGDKVKIVIVKED